MDVPDAEIKQFCQRHHVRKLSLFGSVLRDDFSDDSDVDVLIEFEPGHSTGYFGLIDMQDELSAMFGGRAVDIVTIKFLNHRLRKHVLKEAQVVYEG
jgi:predicted nucleotidyltransferase